MVKGLISELKVADYYLKLGYEVVAHRYLLTFAEIDLILRNEQEVLLVEVKSLSNSDFVSYRVRGRQKQRLLRALKFMQTRFSLPVRLHLATVTKDGEIEIYADFLS